MTQGQTYGELPMEPRILFLSSRLRVDMPTARVVVVNAMLRRRINYMNARVGHSCFAEHRSAVGVLFGNIFLLVGCGHHHPLCVEMQQHRAPFRQRSPYHWCQPFPFRWCRDRQQGDGVPRESPIPVSVSAYWHVWCWDQPRTGHGRQRPLPQIPCDHHEPCACSDMPDIGDRSASAAGFDPGDGFDPDDGLNDRRDPDCRGESNAVWSSMCVLGCVFTLKSGFASSTGSGGSSRDEKMRGQDTYGVWLSPLASLAQQSTLGIEICRSYGYVHSGCVLASRASASVPSSTLDEVVLNTASVPGTALPRNKRPASTCATGGFQVELAGSAIDVSGPRLTITAPIVLVGVDVLGVRVFSGASVMAHMPFPPANQKENLAHSRALEGKFIHKSRRGEVQMRSSEIRPTELNAQINQPRSGRGVATCQSYMHNPDHRAPEKNNFKNVQFSKRPYHLIKAPPGR
ncbi:hypothetical protein AG1IA_06299 [Rhizoctonia solani AG-1 IA]|uniref:Uncharacterized protein n=1 Tax=Thanatephorus cucumeris (strain AG1-IA) TaxID=983506 RepID=L8WTI1_THACA|nr:hypothetical protein AG1IA_06299 [Rhizoctonia solani AG-1 IA]